MLSKILIIDRRKELSTKYKKTLENEEISVEIANNLKKAISDIQSIEPDLILVSDSIEEKLYDFCARIRSLTYNTRPVVIALSKSADSGDRILALDSGADDFLSEPVNIEEFKTRINAHLRRDIESNLDNKTLLPNKKMTDKILKRIFSSKNHQAILLVSIENLQNYTSVYSELAGDKLIQTFVAITKSAIESGDFIGQISDNQFIIVTSAYSAEKLSAFLTFAFDTVAPKFYSETDAKRGYMLLKNDGFAGMRADFVSILIGGILDNFEYINTLSGLYEKLYSVKNLAKIPYGSNYAIDRPRITGSNSIKNSNYNKTIYINEADNALMLLLRTALELQGYDVTEHLDVENVEQPSILIIDSGEDLSGLSFCKEIKTMKNFVNSKIIVTSTIHDKIAVLDAGADLYLPKPYELTDLIKWVEYFLKNI